jgi:hypothetical protein
MKTRQLTTVLLLLGGVTTLFGFRTYQDRPFVVPDKSRMFTTKSSEVPIVRETEVAIWDQKSGKWWILGAGGSVQFEAVSNVAPPVLYGSYWITQITKQAKPLPIRRLTGDDHVAPGCIQLEVPLIKR